MFYLPPIHLPCFHFMPEGIKLVTESFRYSVFSTTIFRLSLPMAQL